MAPPSRSAQESPTPAATAVAGLSGVAASAKTGDLSVLDLSELLEQLAASRAISVNRQKAKKLRGDSRFMGIQPITAVGCLRITAHLLVNNFNRRATVHLFLLNLTLLLLGFLRSTRHIVPASHGNSQRLSPPHLGTQETALSHFPKQMSRS